MDELSAVDSSTDMGLGICLMRRVTKSFTGFAELPRGARDGLVALLPPPSRVFIAKGRSYTTEVVNILACSGLEPFVERLLDCDGIGS